MSTFIDLTNDDDQPLRQRRRVLECHDPYRMPNDMNVCPAGYRMVRFSDPTTGRFAGCCQPEICVVCGDDECKQLLVTTEQCEHLICATCLQSQVDAALTETKFPLRCAGCFGARRTPLPFDTLVNAPLVNAHSIAMRQIGSLIDPSERVTCRNCSTSSYKISGVQAGVAVCPGCNQNICGLCGRDWHRHDNLTCAQATVAEQRPEETLQNSRALGVMSCPTCQTMVIKPYFHKCHHITCTCGYQWCNQCNRPYIQGNNLPPGMCNAFCISLNCGANCVCQPCMDCRGPVYEGNNIIKKAYACDDCSDAYCPVYNGFVKHGSILGPEIKRLIQERLYARLGKKRMIIQPIIATAAWLEARGYMIPKQYDRQVKHPVPKNLPGWVTTAMTSMDTKTRKELELAFAEGHAVNMAVDAETRAMKSQIEAPPEDTKEEEETTESYEASASNNQAHLNNILTSHTQQAEAEAILRQARLRIDMYFRNGQTYEQVVNRYVNNGTLTPSLQEEIDRLADQHGIERILVEPPTVVSPHEPVLNRIPSSEEDSDSDQDSKEDANVLRQEVINRLALQMLNERLERRRRRKARKGT